MSTANYFVTFKSAIARIYNKNGKVIGAGFLVSQYHLLTCAHVVTAALGIITNIQESPDGIIELDFPLIAPGQKLKAKVVFWQPVNPGQSKEDIAGLQIEETLPMGVSPVKLVTTSDYWQHKFRIFGFPQGHDTGVWADGELRDVQATRWIQIEAIKVTGYQIEPGFSGSPIWDATLQGVVGMAVAAEKKREGVKAAFMIPTTVLVEAWSFLNLISILTTNPNTAITSIIQKAYHTCCSPNLPQNIPTTIEDIVKDLYDLDKINLDSKVKFNPNGHTAKFLQYLINNNNVPHDISEQLKTWGQQYIENFVSTPAHSTDEANQNIILESYILIKIEPSKITTRSRAKNTKFKISGCVIPNSQNLEEYPLDVSDSSNDSFKLEQIPEKLNLILTEKITVPLQKDINLVFFLPTEMLNYPVEKWIITENNVPYPLGKKYRVIVRDYNRLLPQYVKYQGTWISKWKQIDRHQVCEKIFRTYKDSHDQDSLLEILDDAIGIIIAAFSEEEYKEIFAYFLNSATPLGICYRHNNQFTQLSDCLNCSVFELPEKVKKQRLNSRIQDPNHIGHHISLILENPNIKPQKIYY